VEIVEQLQVLAFRNPWNFVFCPEPFPLVQPPAAFAGIAGLAHLEYPWPSSPAELERYSVNAVRLTNRKLVLVIERHVLN